MRLILTADWQLGKGFGGLPPDPAALLRRARLEAVARIAALAAERGAAAVLVAGDVFDHAAPADDTLRRMIEATRGFAGPWVLLPGNHDPALPEGAWARLRRLGPPETLLIADRPEVIRIGAAAILPAPLSRRHEAADLTRWFDAAETPGARFRVGLAHGALTGVLPEGADALNPVAADRAVRARLDLLALGDWHGTFLADARTVYPGTPEPDRHRANASGAVLVADLEEGAPPRIERVETLRHPWRRVALTAAPGLDLTAAIAAAAAPGPGEPVLRLDLSGVVSLAEREALVAAAEAARARCLHLEIDESGLALAPSADDLAAIAPGGVLRAAAEALAAKLDGPEGPAARRALAHLVTLAREGGA